MCANSRCQNVVTLKLTGKRGPQARYCNEKCRKLAHQYRNNLKRQDGDRRRKYGITGDQFRAMDAAQSGLCAICNQPPTNGRWKRRLDIDHNHATKQVRGLLCWNCNRMIGTAHENSDVLRRAAEYIEKWNNA